MSPFAEQFESFAELLDERFGETITYHREQQSLTVTGAIKSQPRLEDQAQTRQPTRPELVYVDWTFSVSQLGDLWDAARGEADWIEDAAGDRYTVITVEGNEDWDYVTPDKTRVRIRTIPDNDDS